MNRYNLHTIKCKLQLDELWQIYTYVAITTIKIWDTSPSNLHLHCSPNFLCPLPANTHPHPWPQETTDFFLSLQIGLVFPRMSHKQNHTLSTVWCLASRVQPVFEIRVIAWKFLLFYYYYFCMNMSHFVHPFTSWWTPELFHSLSIMNDATLNILPASLCGYMLLFLWGM